MTVAEKRKLLTGTQLAPASRSTILARAASPDPTAPADAATPTVPGLDLAARTLTLTFSSEAPVERWFGAEVLSHAPGAADLSRLNDGAPLLFNHNMDDVLGVVVSASIGSDRKGYATVRFANTPRASEVMGMVADGILRNVSFMYQASKYCIESEEEDPYYDPDATYTATSWMAYEVSIVSVPADQSVGVGRALTLEAQSVTVETQRRTVPPPAPANPQLIGETMKFRNHPILREQADAVRSTGGGSAPTGAPDNTDPVLAERQRSTAIGSLCRSHNVPQDVAQTMIDKGTTIAEARGIVLERIERQNGQGPVASLGHAHVDLTDKEKRSYSLIRAVQATVNNDWKKAGFEREVSVEISKRTEKETNGFFMPTNLPFAPDETHLRAWNMQGGQRLQTRAPYQVGTAAQGGNLVATNLLADNFIEVLRNASVTAQLGARYLTDLVGKVDIPRQSAASTVGWVGESIAGGESEATFDKVTLSPKTVATWSVMSRLMMLQSTPSIEMIAREDLLAVAALALDLAAMSGTGAGGQPLGIVNQSGVKSIVGGVDGLPLSFDQIIQLKTAPKVANATMSNMAFAINCKSQGYLETLKSTTGQYLWSDNGSAANGAGPTLKGERYVASQQLRSNLTKGASAGICSELIYGNWRELLIGMWGVMEIAVNPYDSTGFKNGDVILRVMQTADVGVRHGASFAIQSDALTPGF